MSENPTLRDIGLAATSISSFVYEMPIDKVEASCFLNNDKLTSIVLLSVEQALPVGAFSGCTELQKITLPGLTTFADIFEPSRPDKLEEVVLNEGTQDIGTAFANLTSLQQIDFPESLTAFQAGALENDNKIDILKLKRNVSVLLNAFTGMEGLRDVEFPLNTSVGSYGLKDLDNLQNIVVLNPNLGASYSLPGAALSGCKAFSMLFEDYGEGLANVAAESFKDCTNLQELNLSNSNVAVLPSNVFNGCSNLDRVQLKGTLAKTIQENAFLGAKYQVNLAGASILTSILYPGTRVNYADPFYIAERVTLDLVGTSAFYQARFADNRVVFTPDALGENAFEASYLSAASVNLNYLPGKALPKQTFARCTSLLSADLKNVKTIKESAFVNSAILTITMNTSDVAVEASAFQACYNLENIDFSRISSVGDRAFLYCSMVNTDKNMLSSLKLVESFAFDSALELEELSVRSLLFLISAFCQDSFKNCRIQKIVSEDTTIDTLNFHLSGLVGGGSLRPASPEPANVKAVYTRLKAYFGFAEDFELILSDYTFNKDGTGNNYACLILELVDGVWHLKQFDTTAPDKDAFLANPVIPSLVTYINDGVFKSNTLLTSLQLNNVQQVGISAFAGCTNLVRVENASHLVNVHGSGFCNCTKLSSFDFSNLRFAEISAFAKCSLLSTLGIPKMQSAGDYAFAQCLRVTDAYMPSILEVGEDMFKLCTALSSVDFGEAELNTLSVGVFRDCSKLKTLTLNDKLHSFGERSLEGSYILSAMFPTRSSETLDYIIDFTNNFKIQAGAKIYDLNNECTYPAYIATSLNSIFKVPNPAFNVEFSSGNLNLKKVDDRFLDPLGNVTINSSELENLKVKNGAFSGNEKVRIVNIDEALTSNIEAGAFAGAANLVAVYVNGATFAIDDIRKATFIDWVGKDSSTRIYFTNGYLRSKHNGTYNWDFIATDSMFIPDPGNLRRLIGIDDSKVPAGDYDATLLGAFDRIASGALSTTHILTSFTTNGLIKDVEASAFYGNTSLIDVTFLNDPLTSIGHDAFAYTLIKQVNIPGTMVKVDGYGLNNTYLLRNLTYGEGITEINNSAMIDCASILSVLTLPTTLRKIGDYAFAEKKSFFPYLHDVHFASLTNLTSIGKYAFYNSIRSSVDGKLTLPSHLLSVGDAAFGYAEDAWTQDISSLNLENIEDPSGPGSLDARNVKDIGMSAFIYNHLREVRFNKNGGLSSIGDYAFAYPKYKYTMQIPKSIKHIGANALKGNIILNPDAVSKNIISVAVDSIPRLLAAINSLSSPDYSADNTIGVTNHTCIVANGDGAAAGSNYLYAYNKRLHFSPDGLSVDIFSKALTGSEKDIVSVYVPPYVTLLSAGAFSGCTELLSAVLPNESIYIGPSAFCDCSKLQSINGPSTFWLSCVEPYTFYGCGKLQNVKLLSVTTYVGRSAFLGCSSLTTLQDVDYDSVDYYSMLSIDTSAFADCKALSTFFIPSDILYIGASTFRNCTSLLTLNIDLDSSSFRDLVDPSYTVSLAVRSKFRDINYSAPTCRICFTDSVYMNDGNVKIDSEFVRYRSVPSMETSAVSAVDYISLLKSGQTYLNLSAVHQIDPFVFRGLTELQSINILPTMTTSLEIIGDYSFSKCKSLIRLNSNNLDCRVIGMYAFADCELLNKMQLDLDKIDFVGLGAFYNTSLQTLTFKSECNSESQESLFLSLLKDAINYNETENPNPLELPEDCLIEVVSKSTGALLGRYDFMLHSLLHSDVDINRNAMVFVDKLRGSIKPVLLVKPIDGHLPALTHNLFHASVIGRWK